MMPTAIFAISSLGLKANERRNENIYKSTICIYFSSSLPRPASFFEFIFIVLDFKYLLFTFSSFLVLCSWFLLIYYTYYIFMVKENNYISSSFSFHRIVHIDSRCESLRIHIFTSFDFVIGFCIFFYFWNSFFFFIY
jgi:hypothetical protein